MSRDKIHKNDKGHYACNHALGPDVKRKSNTWAKVTCQNCLKRKKR